MKQKKCYVAVGRVEAVVSGIVVAEETDAEGSAEVVDFEEKTGASFEIGPTLAVGSKAKHHELGCSYPVRANFEAGIDGVQCLACHRWSILHIADARSAHRDPESWFCQKVECHGRYSRGHASACEKMMAGCNSADHIHWPSLRLPAWNCPDPGPLHSPCS